MTQYPTAWPTKRLRVVAKVGGNGIVEALLDDRQDATFLPMEAIGEQGELDLSLTRRVSDVKSGYSRFSDGDVVVAKITPCFENGKGALIRGTRNGIGFGTTELHVVTPGPRLDGRFLYYVTAQPRFRRLGEATMAGAAGQQRVSEQFVRDFPIRVPPLSRQRAIGDYLDLETTRIDALVSAKQKLIGLVREKRVALITRAVTTGLNDDVSLQDVGLPWQREIPSHWYVQKIGKLSRVGNGGTPSRGDGRFWVRGTIPWLNSGAVNQHEVLSSKEHVTDAALRECHLPLLGPGTVLVATIGQGKTRGRATVLSTRATINQNVAFIAPDRERLDPWFLRWWLFAAYAFLRSMSDDARGPKGVLSCEDLAHLRIPVPPLAEQRAIVSHIAFENMVLKMVDSVAARSIDLLKERRQALIEAAVTGQVDVERPA